MRPLGWVRPFQGVIVVFLCNRRRKPLYEPRRQPLGSPHTIDVGNKVRRAGLHNVLKMVSKQRIVKGGGNADTNYHLIKNITRLVLEAASLQWMECKEGLSKRTHRFLRKSAVCMESLVAKIIGQEAPAQ